MGSHAQRVNILVALARRIPFPARTRFLLLCWTLLSITLDVVVRRLDEGVCVRGPHRCQVILATSAVHGTTEPRTKKKSKTGKKPKRNEVEKVVKRRI